MHLIDVENAVNQRRADMLRWNNIDRDDLPFRLRSAQDELRRAEARRDHLAQAQQLLAATALLVAAELASEQRNWSRLVSLWKQSLVALEGLGSCLQPGLRLGTKKRPLLLAELQRATDRLSTLFQGQNTWVERLRPKVLVLEQEVSAGLPSADLTEQQLAQLEDFREALQQYNAEVEAWNEANGRVKLAQAQGASPEEVRRLRQLRPERPAERSAASILLQVQQRRRRLGKSQDRKAGEITS